MTFTFSHLLSFFFFTFCPSPCGINVPAYFLFTKVYIRDTMTPYLTSKVISNSRRGGRKLFFLTENGQTQTWQACQRSKVVQKGSKWPTLVFSIIWNPSGPYCTILNKNYFFAPEHLRQTLLCPFGDCKASLSKLQCGPQQMCDPI